MKSETVKIVLVREESRDTFNKTKGFLEDNHYRIKEASQRTDGEYYLEADNKEKRFWKLFIGNRPQVLKFLFKTAPDKKDHVQIRTLFGYFKYFLPKIYLLILFSLVLFHLAFSGFVSAVESPDTDPILFMLFAGLGLTLFVIYTMLFFAKLLIGFYDYDEFLSGLYNLIDPNHIEKYFRRGSRQKIVFAASIAGIGLLLLPYMREFFLLPNSLAVIIIALLGVALILLIMFFGLFQSSVLRRILFLAHVINGVLAATVYLHMFTITGLIYKNFGRQGLLLSEAVETMFKEQVAMPNLAQFAISIFLASPFFILAIFIVVFYSHLFKRVDALQEEIRNFKKDQRIYDSSSALAYRNTSKNHLVFSIVIFILWLVFGLALALGIVFCFGFLEYAVIGRNYLFNFGFLNFITTELQALYVFIFHKTPLHNNFYLFRIFFLVYLLPALFLVFMQLRANMKRFIGSRTILKGYKSDFRIQEMIDKIAIASNVEIPRHCITDEPGISVKSLYVGIPYKKNYILISKTAQGKLSREELEGILAHEVFHVKKHTFIFRVLNLLSDWTLMGKGFLANVLNPVKMEFDADDFAVYWLKEQGVEIENYIRALKRTEILKAMTIFAGPVQSLGIMESGSHSKRRGKEGFVQKARILLDLYFGEKMLSYVYPTTEERIERIKGLTHIV